MVATNTAPVSPPARETHAQEINWLFKTVNFGDAGIATGVAFDNSIPAGAFIIGTWVEVQIAFNAGTTNPFTVGTNSTSYNDLFSIADGPGNNTTSFSVGTTLATRGMGGLIAASAAKTPYVKYTQTGGAATTGKAHVLIAYAVTVRG